MSSSYLSQFRETNTREDGVRDRRWHKVKKTKVETGWKIPKGETHRGRKKRRERVSQKGQRKGGTQTKAENWQKGSLVLISRGTAQQAPRCQDRKGHWPAPHVAAFHEEVGGMVERACCLCGGQESPLGFQPWNKQVEVGKPMVRHKSLIFKKLKKKKIPADYQRKCRGVWWEIMRVSETLLLPPFTLLILIMRESDSMSMVLLLTFRVYGSQHIWK